MDFSKVIDDEIIENFSLDGVYEEVISFGELSENLYNKTQSEQVKMQIIKYFENVIK